MKWNMRRYFKSDSAALLTFVCIVATTMIGTQVHAQTTVALSASTPDRGVTKIFVDRFVENITKETDGAYQFERFMGGALGGEGEILELLRLNEVQIGLAYIGSARYYPEYDATQLPFLFPSLDSALAFLWGPISEQIDSALETKGNVVRLAHYPVGKRWLTTSGVRVTGPEDLKGLKIRLPEIPLWLAVWKELGALPTPISSAENFSALQTGIVDGQENFLSTIHGLRLYEVQDYLMPTKHLEMLNLMLVSKPFFDGLPEDHQEVFRNAAKEAVDYTIPRLAEENERLLKDLTEQYGMELVDPNRAAILTSAWPAIEKAGKELLAPGVWELAEEAIEKSASN